MIPSYALSVAEYYAKTSIHRPPILKFVAEGYFSLYEGVAVYHNTKVVGAAGIVLVTEDGVAIADPIPFHIVTALGLSEHAELIGYGEVRPSLRTLPPPKLIRGVSPPGMRVMFSKADMIGASIALTVSEIVSENILAPSALSDPLMRVVVENYDNIARYGKKIAALTQHVTNS